MNFVVVIPARMASTRLPGKPLIPILGKSLIQRTWEQVVKGCPNELVHIVTDDDRIESHCRSFGAQVKMTPHHCLTGTDRVAAFAEMVKAETYINVQGDEPIMNPEDVARVIASAAENPDAVINGYTPITDEADYRSPGVPKVVFRPDGRLLYMSRSPIPGNKAGAFREAYRQICVYAFPAAALHHFAAASEKTPLEHHEDIEILRFLELGYEVRMIRLSDDSVSVDHPEDLLKVERILHAQGS